MSVDARELLDALAARDRLNAHISELVGDFDAAGLWDLDAATSMTAWLSDHGRLSHRDAAHLVSVARRIRELPVTREAWMSGTLSSGQVDAMVANIGGYVELFAEHEAEVVPTLLPLSVRDTTSVMQDWRRHAEAGDEPPEEKEPSNRLHLSATLDGRGKLDGDFDAEGRVLVATALRVAETRDLDAEPARTPAERRADALLDVCQFFLDNQTKKPGGRHRPHLNVILDADTWEGRFPDGTLLPRQTVERLCCDSAMHRVLTDGRSTILDLGMATRVVSAALFTALLIRDGHCRFPGCDRPATWCDGHHVRWFTRGGPTNLDNLVLLCRRHHTRLHKPGWHAKLLPDGTFEVTNPDGLVRTSHPPGTLAGAGGP